MPPLFVLVHRSFFFIILCFSIVCTVRVRFIGRLSDIFFPFSFLFKKFFVECAVWHGIEHRSTQIKSDLCGVRMTISDTIQCHINTNENNEYNENNTNVVSKSSHRFIRLCVLFLLPSNGILGLTTATRSHLFHGRKKRSRRHKTRNCWIEHVVFHTYVYKHNSKSICIEDGRRERKEQYKWSKCVA